jgi:predicted O-linked N-acetylglucosamine transferase (SPINDLY family)
VLVVDDNEDAAESLAALLRIFGHEVGVAFDGEQALAIAPDSAPTLFNRGNVLMELDRRDEAVTSYDRALEREPKFAEAYFSRGVARAFLGRHKDARADLEWAFALDPDLRFTPGLLLNLRQHFCDWAAYDDLAKTVIADVRQQKPVAYPFVFLGVADSAEDQLLCAQTWVREECPPSPTPLWQGEQYGHDRIRLAYLSSDFREHAVAYLTAGLFERHDRERFETIALSFGPDDSSAMRSRLKNAFERFVDVRHRNDADLARLVRELEIDILVDLNGYTTNARTGVLARRPAPVQVNYLGYPGTMGTEYVDYIIADPFVIPAGRQAHYAEKVVHLPDTFQANDNARPPTGRAASRAELGLPADAIVFCSFNNSYKITPRMFDVWMRLLARVDGSVLWVLGSDATTEANLRREATARGVAPSRLIFAARLQYADYLARYRAADLFLDTLPFNGGTTASDALWAGLPVLTCTGDAFAARMAGSLLNAIALPELITDSLAEYEALALRLATDAALLAAITQKLRRNRDTHPLFDTDRFRRHLEAAYTTMFERCQRGEASAGFAVARIPEDADELNRRGNALRKLGRYDEALLSYDRALALRPDYHAAHYNRSNVLLELDRPDEAVASLDRVLAGNPNDAEALTVRGNALLELGRPEEALASYDRALTLAPNALAALYNRGNVLADLGRHQEALAAYAAAIAIDPGCADAHYNESLCRLLMGDLAGGWRKYEWRWRNEQFTRHVREFAQPLWLGEQLAPGTTVLLHAEQALGDTIQFCRYTSLVAARGMTVVLEVQWPLQSLLAQLPGVSQVLCRGQILPAFDYHCPLLSLPLAFGTRLETIPATTPYLSADPRKVEQWRERANAANGLRVGLAWSGSLSQRKDRRPIPVAPLLDALPSGVSVFSLQKELRDADLHLLEERRDARHFGGQLEDFTDTAALIELMDLVITVDTSVAHLAGAMGKPVWILLPFNPDWRWLLDRADNPWYPTARLFRQPAQGEWNPVIEQVANELRALSMSQG